VRRQFVGVCPFEFRDDFRDLDDRFAAVGVEFAVDDIAVGAGTHSGPLTALAIKKFVSPVSGRSSRPSAVDFRVRRDKTSGRPAPLRESAQLLLGGE
jgi:hypothetical protein